MVSILNARSLRSQRDTRTGSELAVSDPVTARSAICLNMIVRNEAHIVERVLDAVAPYVSSWVIVDTGSDDGTQDVIRNHMARLGIPGELYERPWCNFGHKLEADVNVWQLCGRKAGSYPRPRALHELSISIVHAFFLAFGAMMARTQLLNVE